jgi:hypothetical protein
MPRGMVSLLVVAGLGTAVALGCSDDDDDDDDDENAAQGIPCVADDTCYLECAADPDCADSSEPGPDGAAGSAGANGEASCASDEKLCDGECVSTDSPRFGCADPDSCGPCYVERGSAGCDQDGNCAISSCTSPYWDCNELYDDGCEVDRDNDVENCGACGYSCEEQEPGAGTNAEIRCAQGRCVIRMCDPGFGDCNDLLADGCEVDLSSSREHCGACDSPCAETEDCVDGSCLAD